ncbi:PepSY-like domain-containing protein [Emticicia sp. TH156]|uniref:PepSY-like domain-containing protein n=1 Tax=Emticicia sp. TH156 TaxID=2067454 RepID=UPI000C759878|nr:PepSY-like domain-containing protein [Emticicia sp. TH156]PLK44938.1 hypothetical protein C0V77_06745 [Emticicia sp. TH156]
MKRNTASLTTLAIALSTVVFAQRLAADKVPAAIKQAFAKAYPTAKAVKWDKEGKDYEASFEQGEDELSVVFDEKGQVLETEKEIKFSELPAAVQQALKGKKVKEAAIIMKGGKTMYEAEVGGKDLMFDSEGKPIK